MKQKSGFTLIEMLGTLVVLSIIVATSVPAITSMLKRSNEQRYEEWLKSLYIATEEYVESHRENFYEINNGGTSYLSIKQLLDQGYLRSSVKDPKTGNDITEVAIVEITLNEDQELQYRIIYKTDLDSITISVGINPDAAVEPWTSKDVVLTVYAESGTGLRVDQYSFDGGTTWQASNKKTVTTNGTYNILARDSRFDQRSTSKKITISHIDKTAPTVSNTIVNLVTTKSITVRAECADSESGIRGYRFSKDDGATWTDERLNSSYKFDDLTTGTYKLKVQCVNNSGLPKNTSSL